MSMILRAVGCSSGNWYGKVASRARVLRIMRESNLLSPYRHDAKTVKVRKHEGTIVQSCPDRLWGTDGKRFFVEDVGWCWFFGVIDHFKTLDEANAAIAKFVENYNREWLIYRLGYKSPLEYMEEYMAKVA